MSNENKRKYIVEFDVNKASLNQLKSTIQEIQKMSVGDFKAASPQGFNSFEEARVELQRIKKLTAEVDKALEDAFNPQMGVPNLTKLTDSIKKIGVDNIARSWDQLGMVGSSATRQLATGLIATNTQLKQSHKLLDDMATSFKNTVKWGISSTAFNTMTNSLSSAWSYAKNLNKVLTDIRIVSDQSASDMERFAKQAAKAAKELGATTLDYGNAALLYYQQGDSPEQVAEKANLTVKMANVLGASASEVSNYMTAIWNNFDDGSKTLEYYADVLTKLGAATASSAEEISDGLEKFAAVANTVDLSYEYATAALTTITATTRQSADVVGTALKTLFARIQDLELGETLDDGTTLGKYSEALEKVGISLKGQDGQLRSMDDLLNDMGAKWQTLTKNQKVALAQTVAGTRQYTQLVALMDNWDVMQQNIKLAQEATGSLQEQQDKYMESTAAHLNKLTASAERFMDALIDDNVINGLIDSLTVVTDLLGSFVEGVGGGTNALFMLGSIGADVFSKQITNSLLVTIQNLKTAARAAQETRTSFDNLGTMDVLWEGEDNTVQRIKKDLLSVESEMDADDIKVVNEQLQQLGAETDKLIRANEAVEQAVEQYKQFGGSGPDDAHSEFDLRDTEQFGEIFNTVSADTKKLETDMKNLDNAYSKLIQDKDMSALTDFIDKFETGKKDMQEFGEAYKNVFNEGELQEIEDATIQMEKFVANLQQIKDDKNFSDDERSDAILDALSSDTKSHRGYISSNAQGIEAVGKKATNVLNTLGAQGEANYNRVVEASGDARKKILRDLDDIFNRFKDAKEVRAFVKTLSGAGEAISSILALSNLGDILNDEDLSGWEKFAQLTLTLSVAIPTLINGVSDFFGGIKTLGDFLSGIWQGVSETVNATKTVTANKVIEESAENVTKEYKELNKTISVDNAAATNAKLIEDQKQIASNNAVIVSIKARKAAEKDGVGENLVEGVSEAVTEKVGKEVGEEIVEKSITKGVANATSSGVWATLKGKVAGILGGGASGASGVGTLGAMLGKIATVALPAAAAIGVVAGAVALMTHEQRKAEKQAKALALAIEETKASYNSALSAAQGFSSGLSSLESAIKAVNSLTEGTREWKLALLEANEQAFSLLETYPELAGYMQKTNGYITFTEEGIDSISNKLYARTQTVQNMYFEAQQKQLQFEFDQLSKQVAKSAVNFSKLRLSTEEIEKTFDFAQNYQPLQPGDSGQVVKKVTEDQKLTTADAITIIRAFKGNEDLLFSKKDTTDEIIDLLKKNNIDLSRFSIESKEAFVEDLKSNAKEISNFTLSIDEYTAKIAAYTQALLGDDEVPEDATDYDYVIAKQKKYDEIYNQEKKDLDAKNPKDSKADREALAKEFADILGYNTKDKGSYYQSSMGSQLKIGTSSENAQAYTWEEVKEVIAENRTNEKLQTDAVKKEIQQDAIDQTNLTKSYPGAYHTSEYRMLHDKIRNGEIPYSNYRIEETGPDSFNFIFTDPTPEEKQRTDDEFAKRSSFDYAMNTIFQEYWQRKSAGEDPAQLVEEYKSKGYIIYDNTDIGGISSVGVDAGTIRSIIAREVVESNLAKAGITPDDAWFFSSRTTTLPDGTVKENNHYLSEDLEENKQLAIGGKSDTGSMGSGTGYEKWKEDIFYERDVNSLWKPSETQYFYNMLESEYQSIGKDNWDKYYDKTFYGNELGFYGLAGKYEQNSHNITDEEWQKNYDKETEKLFQEDLANRAEKNGDSLESYRAYADQMREDNKLIEKNIKNKREQNELIAEATELHFEFAKKLNTVNEAVQDNDDLLREWAKSGVHDLNALDPNDAEKIGKVVEAVQGMFGEEVDTNWVQDHVDQIIKLANGDMSVYDDLQKDYLKLKVKGLEIDPEGKAGLSEEEKAKVHTELSEDMDILLGKLDTENLEIGATVTMDTQPYLYALGTMVSEGKLTEQQISDMFGEIGFDVVWEQRKKPTNLVTKLLKDEFGWELPGTFGYETVSVPKLIWKDTNAKTFTPSVPPTTGGGKSSKPSKVSKTEDNFDRYHDVDTELKKIANSMAEVKRTTDRSTGSQWIDNLKEQFSLLNQEIGTTEEKLKIAEGELAELQGKLAAEGAVFGEDGTLLNYKEIYYDALNELNAAEDKMNSFSSTDAQDKYRPQYEAAQERYDKIVELISRYDEVFLDLIPGLKQDIKEKIDEQTQIKIDVFNKEIEIRLEMADFERDWRDFKRTVIDGIKEDDILGNLRADLDQFGIYYDEFGKGTIQKLTDQIQKDMEQLAQFEAKEDMSIYKDFSATQLEDMKAHIESLMSEMENFYELTERIRESYLNMMDEAKEKFDEQIEKYGQVASLLEHDLNLISMIYGEDAYSDMAQYYDQIHENNLNSLDMLRMEADFWAEEMKKHDKSSEEYKKAEENWTSVVSELTSKTEESITNIQNRFTNAVEAIFQKLNDEVTAGKGLDYLSKQWELVNQNADMYLDNMNGIYAIQKLQNKYQEAIDNNDSLKAQKELKTIMDEELKALREKDKLTQYDVDRAELRYQIALKQIALEEAQQNKSKMRLRRDSQGNYTYQYTADEEQINSLQSEMTDLYQQLYNLDANQYKNNLDQLYSVWVQFQEDMKAAEAINDETEKQERKKMLTEQYGKMINNLVAQDEEIKKNLYESTMSGLLDLYDSNAENYNNMTVEQQEILNNFLDEQGKLTGTAYNNLFGLYQDGVMKFREMADSQKAILVSSMLPTWNTTLAEMAKTLADKGGFTEVCKNAFKELDDANKAYQLGLKDIETKAGTSFEEVKKGYDKNTAAAKLLIAENGKLIQTYKDNLAEVAKLIKDMEDLILKYEEAAKAAKAYGEAAYEAWKKAQGDNADDAHDDADKILNPEPEPEPEPQPEPEKPKEIKNGGFVTAGGAKIYTWPNTTGLTQYYGDDPKYKVLDATTYSDWAQVRYHKLDSGVTGWFKKKDLTALRSGGYTGNWNSAEGRLALLHEKELVLNAQDTKNMLNAIKIVRTITDNLGMSLLNRMGAIAANTGNGLLGNADALEQIVHIDAQFPNVTNSSEIEDALNNLVNRAAQHITKN